MGHARPFALPAPPVPGPSPKCPFQARGQKAKVQLPNAGLCQLAPRQGQPPQPATTMSPQVWARSYTQLPAHCQPHPPRQTPCPLTGAGVWIWDSPDAALCQMYALSTNVPVCFHVWGLFPFSHSLEGQERSSFPGGQPTESLPLWFGRVGRGWSCLVFRYTQALMPDRSTVATGHLTELGFCPEQVTG